MSKYLKKKSNHKLMKIKLFKLPKNYNDKYDYSKSCDLDSEDYLQKKMMSEIKNNIFKDNKLNINKRKADINYKENKNEILPSPLPTSEKNIKSPKIKNSFNVFEIIITQFFKCCICHDIKIKKIVNENANEIINQKLDIITYIRNMILFDIINRTILDDDRKEIINFLCRPIITVNNNEKNEFDIFYKNYKKQNFEKLSNNIKGLLQNPEKLEKEQKLLYFCKEHLKKFE